MLKLYHFERLNIPTLYETLQYYQFIINRHITGVIMTGVVETIIWFLKNNYSRFFDVFLCQFINFCDAFVSSASNLFKNVCTLF